MFLIGLIVSGRNTCMADATVKTTPTTAGQCPSGWICPSTPLLRPDTKVGAWYSIYFYVRGTVAQDHWSSTRYKPTLGYYSSGDIIQGQYPLMKEAGLNYILLDHTNGFGNDNGAINANAIKVFNKLPHDISIAVANGAPLWVSHDGQVKFINRDQRLASQKFEADYLLSNFANRPNYLKWFDSKTNSTKPLFVVFNDIQNDHPNDEIVRYWDDPRLSVRYSAGFADNTNPLLIPYASKGGLWGWAVKYPQLPSSETMAVQPGWQTDHLTDGRPSVQPLLREGGMFYMKQWLEIIKHKPANVIIASWNDWAEENAIEPASVVNPSAEPFRDYHGEETPDWYLQITKGYTNLRTGLMPNTFYKMENDPRIFQVVDGKLVLQNSMPRKKPFILLPQGSLNSFIGGTGTTPSNQIPAGLFKIGIGLYQSQGTSYCYFQSMSDFTAITGKTNADGITSYSSIPATMTNGGNCKVTTPSIPPMTPSPSPQMPAGLFKIGIGLYQSQGSSYCYFQSMSDFTAITGRTNAEGITSYPSIPTSMSNGGTCRVTTTPSTPSAPVQIPTGLFMIGAGLYESFGTSYCYFQSMTDFTAITGKTNAAGITSYPSIPSNMTNGGTCRVTTTPPITTPPTSVVFTENSNSAILSASNISGAPREASILQRQSNGSATLRLAPIVPNGVYYYRYKLISPGNTQVSSVQKYIKDSSLDVPVSSGMRSMTVQLQFFDVTGMEKWRWTSANFSVGDVFLVAGQSNAANHGEIATQSQYELNHVLDAQFGKWSALKDPLPVATSFDKNFGSPWPTFADKLSDITGKPVGISSVAYGGSSVSLWLHGSNGTSPFVERLIMAAKALPGCNFKAVLWHQGETDAINGTTRDVYKSLMVQLRNKFIQETGCQQPWIVANASYVPPSFNTSQSKMDVIRQAQQDLWRTTGFMQGPDTDTQISIQERYDTLHFALSGQRKHGALWAEKVKDFVGGADKIPAGLFMLGAGIYQSAGNSYCVFGSMSDFTNATGRTNADGINRVQSIPSSMQNTGSCKTPGY